MHRRALLLSALGAMAAQPAWAWPERAIRLLVAYPPGGLSDETARLLAQSLGRHLNVSVLVENRSGAGGVAAMEALARAAPDGYTLCYSAISPLVIAPRLSRPAYDAQNDFAPLAWVMDTPILLLARADLKPDSLPELLALARKKPGQLRWASSGQATTGHLVLEQLKLAADVDIVHVPYKGGGQQLNDALSGQFEVLSSNLGPQQLQYVRQGRLKALAVGAARRLAVLPEVPTLGELGYAQANLVSSFGVFAPRGITSGRSRRLNEALNAAIREPEFQQRLIASGNRSAGGSARDFELWIEHERQRQQQVLSVLEGAVR